MNAQNIWPGTDYAWLPNSSRSQRFTLSCERVKVRRLVKEKVTGNQNATTFVIVQFLDRDTGEVINHDSYYGIEDRIYEGEHTFYKLRAYDIVDYWENVEDEYKHKVAARRKEEEERVARERERREKIAREQYEREQRLQRVQQFLIGLGVDPTWIKYVKLDSNYYSDSGIRLSFDAVEKAMLAELAKSDGDGDRKEVDLITYGGNKDLI